MKKENNQNLGNNGFKALSIILIVIIIALVVYILYTPVTDFFNSKFNAQEILEDETQNIKNQITIEKYNLNNKELVFITNNSDQTIYDVNVMGFFYDNEEKPVSTDSSTYLYFIPSNQTIAVELYCFGEDDKITEFADCIVDLTFATQSDTTNKYFFPMNEALTYENLSTINEAGILILDGEVKNISEHKVDRADIIAVFYKDGVPVASTSGSARSISSNGSRNALFMPIPGVDFDEYKIFVESCYRYSYH